MPATNQSINQSTLFNEGDTKQSVYDWHTCSPQIPDQIMLEFGNVVFLEDRGNRSTWRKTSEQGWEPTTNSTHIWRRVWESNPGHIGGRQVLSPLRHPYPPPHHQMCPGVRTIFVILWYSVLLAYLEKLCDKDRNICPQKSFAQMDSFQMVIYFLDTQHYFTHYLINK